MALVMIHASPLSADQKKRIGDGFLRILHQEGVPSSSTVILFKPEDADIYLDGGLLHEPASAVPTRGESPAPAPIQAPAEVREAPVDFTRPAPATRGSGRPAKTERIALRDRLVQALQVDGALSSFEAQTRLNLKDADWAPNVLRKFFAELEAEGLISKQGQKRGTRYVWKGIVQAGSPALPPVKLVKRPSEEEA
ncbi:MAG: hypothetical protein HY823_01840 [Acidobacteria bacterium]|nr:hypothetical protein [Acidobacteriota bacterium]